MVCARAVPGYDFCPAFAVSAPPPGASADLGAVVVYVGGNGEEMHDSIAKCDRMAERFGVAFVCYSIPGPEAHSRTNSLSARTERACVDLCVFILDEVAVAWPGNVFLWGRSVGASFAAHAACERAVHGVVFEYPLASARAFVTQDHAAVARGMEWMGVDAFDTVAAVCKWGRGRVSRPARVAVIRAGADGLLASSHADAVVRAARANGYDDVVDITVDGYTHAQSATEERDGRPDAARPELEPLSRLLHPGAVAPTSDFVR